MMLKRLLCIVAIISLAIGPAWAQKERVKNQPYADLKWLHLGFHVGVHAQDLLLTNSGVATESGEIWFAEIPSYSPGFSVGVIADMYMISLDLLRMALGYLQHLSRKTLRAMLASHIETRKSHLQEGTSRTAKSRCQCLS